MPRLQYRAAARRDIAEIAAYIEQESQSRAVADALVQSITAHCEHLATLSSMIGRPRPELRAGYRSVTFGNYVIFLRTRMRMGRAAMSISFASFMAPETSTPISRRRQATTTRDCLLPSGRLRVILLRPRTIGTCDVRPQYRPRKPPRAGDLALSPAAQAQPGGLVAVGAGRARRGAAARTSRSCSRSATPPATGAT